MAYRLSVYRPFFKVMKKLKVKRFFTAEGLADFVNTEREKQPLKIESIIYTNMYELYYWE